MNRYYVGLGLPVELDRTIEEVFSLEERERSIGLGVTYDWTPPDALHCTLVFLGEVESMDALIADVGDVASQFRPFRMSLTGPTFLLGDHHLVASAVGAEALAGSLIQKLGHLSSDEELLGRPYLGHVTIAKLSRPEAGGELLGRVLTGSWDVSEIHVIQSYGRDASPRYAVVAAIPLRS